MPRGRNRGGQPGNKNAAGNKGGAPVGNKNAVGNQGGAPPGERNGNFRHGAYERIMFGLLPKDEAEIFSDNETGCRVEAELRRILAALNVKEIRLMKRIADIRSTCYALEKLETELDRVYGRKITILSQLENIQVQRQRLELERKRLEGETQQNKMACEWITALLDEEEELNE